MATIFAYESWQLPSSAPQRSKKNFFKKSCKVHTLLNQGGPKYYSWYSLWSQTLSIKWQSGDVIDHDDFLESFLWLILLTVADSVDILSWSDCSTPSQSKRRVFLAAHQPNNAPLSVINFEWGIKGGCWKNILSKEIQLFPNCIVISIYTEMSVKCKINLFLLKPALVLLSNHKTELF